MYLIDSRDTLSFARERASRLRDDTALVRRARREAALPGPVAPPPRLPLQNRHGAAGAPPGMKAILHERYGRPDVLELRDVDRPALGDGQVLVRVHASSVNPVEWYGVSGPYFARIGNGMRRPKDQTVGADLAGTVEAVGREVKALQPGDEVFGVSGASWAEYTLARENRLARKPSNLSFEEAAAVPVAAVTALQALRDKGQVQPGQKVLVNGASGGVGTFAVQLAKTFGADVTAVCSTGNVEQAQVARRGPRGRLHEGGLHEARRRSTT